MTPGEEMIKARQDIEAWNGRYKAGQAVTLAQDDGTAVDAVTRTIAMERGRQAVVWLKGVPGVWPLSKIKAKD